MVFVNICGNEQRRRKERIWLKCKFISNVLQKIAMHVMEKVSI